MIRHKKDTLICPECEAKLTKCHPDIVKFFRFVKSNFKNIHVAHGWRNKADQDFAFETGASSLKFPFSPHNRMDEKLNPKSWALDLFELVDNKATWPVNVYQKIWVLAQENKYPIYWGGCFTGKMRGDFCHFELLYK